MNLYLQLKLDRACPILVDLMPNALLDLSTILSVFVDQDSMETLRVNGVVGLNVRPTQSAQATRLA